MTKQNMIAEIQAQEAALWLALAEYDNRNAPATGSYSSEIDWDLTDPGHDKHLAAWCALNTLMESLGITSDNSLWERKAAMELSSDLFLRRQAARGITYDENGNEIKRAC